MSNTALDGGKGTAHLDRTFMAIADPTRRAILARLVEGDACVTELADPFAMSLNAVSKHVKVLEGAGLVRRDIRGREHWISFNGEPLERAATWIETYRRFWETRLEAMAQLLQRRRDADAESHG